MASGERWKSYKTKGNVEEGRRRREEEGVQLRKLKREEEVSTMLCPLVTVLTFIFIVADVLTFM